MKIYSDVAIITDRKRTMGRCDGMSGNADGISQRNNMKSQIAVLI